MLSRVIGGIALAASISVLALTGMGYLATHRHPLREADPVPIHSVYVSIV